jgi:uncharacterized protein (DUF1778 family)
MSNAKRMPSVERKTERLELRVAPSVRRVIEQATAISGLAVGDLAYEAARRILDENDRMKLMDEDRAAFLEAVSRTPKPNQRLIAILRAHGKLRR